MKLVICFLLVLILDHSLGQKFDRSVVGVGFEPYVDPHPWRGWNEYSLEDVKKMLRVVSTHFNFLSTYSMGTKDTGHAWDKGDSNCLVARAAAQLNKLEKKRFKVNIGAWQIPDGSVRAREIDNAFKAAADANKISKGTVWGITFTNEYIEQDAQGREVLQMIQSNKNKGLKVGTRTQFCGQLKDGGPLRDVLVDIVKASDFIYCNVYASVEHAKLGPTRAAQEVGNYIMGLRDAFKKVNPKLDFRIGETGWPSAKKSFNLSENSVKNLVEYWKGINAWAKKSRVQVQMFEAMDEDWKGKNADGQDKDFPGESHYGWWRKANNNRNDHTYIEKEGGQ